MKLKPLLLSTVLAASFVAAGSAYGQSATTSQNVTLSKKLKIPGASLKPGDYTFSIEDRLQDRAVVRITTQDQSKHFLLLTVPSAKLGQPGSDGLVRFSSTNGKDQALRGWECPGCTPGLEFVYPKAEAVKLTDETAEPILAVDPASDKLPANLSPDDMKVVTLWLLSPAQITASNKGKGVKAEKYAAASPANADAQQTASASTPEVAQNPASTEPAPVAPPTASNTTTEVARTPAPAASPAPPATPAAAPAVTQPAAQPTEVATTATAPSTAPGPSSGRLPKTASNDYLYLFAGLLLMMGAVGVRLSRRVALPRSVN